MGNTDSTASQSEEPVYLNDITTPTTFSNPSETHELREVRSDLMIFSPNTLVRVDTNRGNIHVGGPNIVLEVQDNYGEINISGANCSLIIARDHTNGRRILNNGPNNSVTIRSQGTSHNHGHNHGHIHAHRPGHVHSRVPPPPSDNRRRDYHIYSPNISHESPRPIPPEEFFSEFNEFASMGGNRIPNQNMRPLNIFQNIGDNMHQGNQQNIHHQTTANRNPNLNDHFPSFASRTFVNGREIENRGQRSGTTISNINGRVFMNGQEVQNTMNMPGFPPRPMDNNHRMNMNMGNRGEFRIDNLFNMLTNMFGAQNPGTMYEPRGRVEGNRLNTAEGGQIEIVEIEPPKADIKEQCSICQCTMSKRYEEVAYIDCMHWFHYDCIKEWLIRKNKCVICKSQVGQLFKVKPAPKPPGYDEEREE